jgi:ComF family protein
MQLLRLLAAVARALLAVAARALSPPACAACDAAAPGTSIFCPSCARTLSPLLSQGVLPAATALTSPDPPPIIAAAPFGGAFAKAIRRFKYDSRPDLARPLGLLLRGAARGAGLRADLVVPVPLHPRRLAERGYNQAALLAAHVAAELGAPVAARGLVRLRDTAQQARLARGARLANTAGAFRVRDPERVRGRAVVVVDDVATTGATLSACCAAILLAGAASVACIVVARAQGSSDDAADGPASIR